MKTNNIRQISQIAARTLKIVGLIMIAATFLDFIVMLIPPDFLNRVWQINLVTQFVDRGIIPMIGIALLLTGIWMTDTVVNSNSDLPAGSFNFKNII
ncbi:MAG: HpsJ family protein, partial [Microcoleaceae cyanobacterium]